MDTKSTQKNDTQSLRLKNMSRGDVVLAQDVRVAESFFARSKGLLGEKSLPAGRALWIKGTRFVDCNSIHTWFMRFSIDAVFVDHNLVVKAVYKDLNPWRMTMPAMGAASVFELPSGTLETAHVEIGDQLHVGS